MFIWYGYFDKFGETKGEERKKDRIKRSNKIKVFEANKSLYP